MTFSQGFFSFFQFELEREPAWKTGYSRDGARLLLFNYSFNFWHKSTDRSNYIARRYFHLLSKATELSWLYFFVKRSRQTLINYGLMTRWSTNRIANDKKNRQTLVWKTSQGLSYYNTQVPHGQKNELHAFKRKLRRWSFITCHIYTSIDNMFSSVTSLQAQSWVFVF